MIKVEDLSFTYAGGIKPALENVSLTLQNQAYVAVTGPIGSGKTTLCKMLKGLLKPSSGRVDFTEPHIGFFHVAYLGGDPYDSLVGTSVEEDVVFGMENYGFSQSEMKARLQQALLWTELAGMEKRLVHTLSGGEQQKLALAGALATGANVLILDEAMNMLDRPVRKSVRALLNALRMDPGLTIVEVTHNPEDIALADRIIFVERGTVSFVSDYSAFAAHPVGKEWARAGGGLAGLEQELTHYGVDLSDCEENSRLSECLLKVIRK
jgi:energy-coupling factor transport system ATP-binding protein